MEVVEVLQRVGCIVMDNLAVRGCGAGLEGWGVWRLYHWDREVRGVRDFRGEIGSFGVLLVE